MEKILGIVDVSDKKITKRTATACAIVHLGDVITHRIKDKKIPKGDVLECAKISAIMIAKKTPDIIPLCHPIGIEQVKIGFELSQDAIKIYAHVKAEAKTGVEMEALAACTGAALTIYDMCKMFSHDICIKQICLIEKKGGKTGNYVKKP